MMQAIDMPSSDDKELFEIVRKNYFKANVDYLKEQTASACHSCANNPINGGSGICHCILGTPIMKGGALCTVTDTHT